MLKRAEIDSILRKRGFGQRLCGRPGFPATLYGTFAKIALSSRVLKDGDVSSSVWNIYSEACLDLLVNLTTRAERDSFRCKPELYDYKDCPPHTLIVDFANKHIGGGCFGGGFVQEEQMVCQST